MKIGHGAKGAESGRTIEIQSPRRFRRGLRNRIRPRGAGQDCRINSCAEPEASGVAERAERKVGKVEKLIKSTTAYAVFSSDAQSGRLSHAYLLHDPDESCLRDALKLFAAAFFGAKEGTPLYRRIAGESYTDLAVYPQEGKKITADGIAALIEDAAMRPVEGGRKLYVICGIENASALVQNKLLKTLEEPLEGIHFLLGAASVAPVLGTVMSRVKLLEIAPFSEEEIFAALERQGKNPLSAAAAKSSGGILGAAQNIVRGGWFGEVSAAAQKICTVRRAGDIAPVAIAYGDIGYKRELLSEMQRLFFSALTEGGALAEIWSEATLVYALEKIDKANADVRFNAFFQGLLYDFMLGVIECERRAQNLRKANLR